MANDIVFLHDLEPQKRQISHLSLFVRGVVSDGGYLHGLGFSCRSLFLSIIDSRKARIVFIKKGSFKPFTRLCVIILSRTSRSSNRIPKKYALGNRSMMKGVHYKTVTSEEDGQRLDNYLLRILKGVPKSHIYRLIRGGEVRVNKKRAKASSRILEGDMVRIPPVRTSPDPEKLTLSDALLARLNASILFENDSLLVINKPSGMAVHGGSGLSFGVIEALRHARPDARYLELIHRIDRETSGCLLIAKKRSMLRAVQALFEAREIQKTYWTLSLNAWHGKQSMRIDCSLQKNILCSGERMVRVDENGKASETTVRLLENYPEACWLEAKPKTGRTHQIRVHTAYIGHPILGDEKYGKPSPPELKKELKQRLYLHAREIQFNLDGKHYSFQADLDAQFDHALQTLRAT